jgi:hypothetical protein
MLEELWGHYLAWDIAHLKMMVEILVESRWGPALASLLKSYTTDIIYSSMTLYKQVETIGEWFRMRQGTELAFHKYFDEPLSKRPFSIVATFIALDNTVQNSFFVTSMEIKEFVQVAHTDISEYEYARFKYSPYLPMLK